MIQLIYYANRIRYKTQVQGCNVPSEVSTGISTNDYEKLCQVFNFHPQLRFICIDVANGYSEHFVAFVKQVRKTFAGKVIIAGNVVTGEMVEELLLAGADIIKVGIGPGSVCTT